MCHLKIDNEGLTVTNGGDDSSGRYEKKKRGRGVKVKERGERVVCQKLKSCDFSCHLVDLPQHQSIITFHLPALAPYLPILSKYSQSFASLSCLQRRLGLSQTAIRG